LIEGAGPVHRLYVEALGVLMAHELIRLHSVAYVAALLGLLIGAGIAPWVAAALGG
jgi:hypothetical protein